MEREEFLKKHTPGKQKLIRIFIENEQSLFDKEELMDKSGLKENTLSQYLKYLRKEGIIDSISHSLFNDANKIGKKYYFYGDKKFIAEIKENPKEWKI
jgi:predicted transcriptional regulator